MAKAIWDGWDGMLRAWQRSTCHHRWLRARWADGTYGLRCSRCMVAYPHTWEEVMGRPTVAPPPASESAAASTLSELSHTA